MDKQRTQIAISASANPADVFLATTDMNPRRQTQPSCEVSGRAELPSVADTSDDRTGSDRPHPWGRDEPLAGLRVSMPDDDLGLHGINPLGRCIDMIKYLADRGAGFRRQEVAADLVHPLTELSNPLN